MFEHVKSLRSAPSKSIRLLYSEKLDRRGGRLCRSLPCILRIVQWRYTLLRSDFSTGTGETKSLTLADGSHVELNARSAIALHYDAGQRRVMLLAGEGWFEVSRDPARPFVVEAAGGTATALGTAFGVDAGTTPDACKCRGTSGGGREAAAKMSSSRKTSRRFMARIPRQTRHRLQ